MRQIRFAALVGVLLVGAGFSRPLQGGLKPAPPASSRTVQSSQAASQWQDVIRNLRHPDAKVRLSAVEQLGEAGYTAAAEYVAPLVTDPDDRVQFAAIDAELTFFLVEPIGGRRVLSLTGGSRSRAQEAFDAGPLVRASSPAPLVLVDNLISAVRDQNARVRFDAVHAVGVIAEAPVPAAQAKGLIDALDHYDPVIRAAAARVIGRLRVAEAGDKLIAGLNDSSPLVRRYCAEALGLIREERAVQSLSQLVDYYRNDAIAADMLLALARIAHGSSRDVFRARIADPNASMRRAAAEGLGRVRDADSIETLRKLSTSDPAGNVRLAAIFGLGFLEAPQTHVLAGSLASPELAGQARDYLLELGPAALPGVQSALGVATDPRYKAELLHLVGYLGSRESSPIVEPFLKDADERVRRAATDATARLAR